jgi:hypothetical protein
VGTDDTGMGDIEGDGAGGGNIPMAMGPTMGVGSSENPGTARTARTSDNARRFISAPSSQGWGE